MEFWSLGGSAPLPINQKQNCVLRPGRFRFVAVVFDVKLGSFGGVMRGVVRVTVCGVGVVGGRFVVPCFVMFRCFPVMLRCVFVMLGCLMMVLCCLFGHGSVLLAKDYGPAGRLLPHR